MGPIPAATEFPSSSCADSEQAQLRSLLTSTMLQTTPMGPCGSGMEELHSMLEARDQELSCLRLELSQLREREAARSKEQEEAILRLRMELEHTRQQALSSPDPAIKHEDSGFLQVERIQPISADSEPVLEPTTQKLNAAGPFLVATPSKPRHVSSAIFHKPTQSSDLLAQAPPVREPIPSDEVGAQKRVRRGSQIQPLSTLLFAPVVSETLSPGSNAGSLSGPVVVIVNQGDSSGSSEKSLPVFSGNRRRSASASSSGPVKLSNVILQPNLDNPLGQDTSTPSSSSSALPTQPPPRKVPFPCHHNTFSSRLHHCISSNEIILFFLVMLRTFLISFSFGPFFLS